VPGPRRAASRLLLLLDLDGTLVDSAVDLLAAEEAGLRALGLPSPGPAWLRARLGGPLSELLADALGRTPAAAERRDFARAFRRHYYGAGYPNSQPLEGVEASLRRLGQRHWLSVATAKPTPAAASLLRHCGLDVLLHHVQGTNPGTPAKPDPAILLAVQRRFGLPRAACVMVGDTPRDVQAGRAAGFRTVGLLPADAPAQQALRAASPDGLIGQFAELEQVLLGWR